MLFPLEISTPAALFILIAPHHGFALATSHSTIADPIYLMTRAHTRGPCKIKDFVGRGRRNKARAAFGFSRKQNLAQFLLTRRLNLHKSNAANERLADGLRYGRYGPWRNTSGQDTLILTALATMRKKTRLAAVPSTVNLL